MRGLAVMAGMVVLALVLVWNALRLTAKPIPALRRRLAAADNERLSAVAAVQAAAADRAAETTSILQDQAGPELFSIRAELGGLSRMARGEGAATEEARKRLTAISESVAQIQRLHGQVIEASKSDPGGL